MNNYRSRHAFSGKEREARRTLYNEPIYRCYYNMLQRCYNPHIPTYRRYGAIGIRVCERWRRSFLAFVEDMYPDWIIKESEGIKVSIDRIDSKGDYEPANCRWATIGEQQRNRSSNINITFRGETKNMTEWGVELFNNKNIIKKRIRILGWTPLRALTTKIKK